MAGHGLTPAEVSGAQSGFNSLQAAIQNILANKIQQQQYNTQNAQKQQELDLAKQREESEEQARKELAQRYKEESTRAEKQLDLQTQQLQLTRDAAHQNMINTIMGGGSVLDDTTTPSQNSPDLLMSGAPGQANVTMAPSTMIHTIQDASGNKFQIELPTQESLANRQAALARITNAPAEEARIREQSAAQEADLGRQLRLAAQQHADRLAELAQEHDYTNDRQNTLITAQKSEQAQAQAAALQGKIIDATGGLLGIPDKYKESLGLGGVTITTDQDGQPQIINKKPADVITNIVNDLYDGNTSIERVKSQYPKQAAMIFQTAKARGVQGLTQAQLDALKGLNDISKPVSDLKSLATLRANQGGFLGSLNPLSSSNTNNPIPGVNQAYQQYKELSQQFGQNIDRVATVLGQVRRQPNTAVMQKLLESLLPDQSSTADPLNGFNKYNTFVKSIQNDYNTITSGLPEGQRQHLLKLFGSATAYPYLSTTVNAPGQNPGTPTNATPALGQPGQQIPPMTLDQIHNLLQHGPGGSGGNQ